MPTLVVARCELGHPPQICIPLEPLVCRKGHKPPGPGSPIRGDSLRAGLAGHRGASERRPYRRGSGDCDREALTVSSFPKRGAPTACQRDPAELMAPKWLVGTNKTVKARIWPRGQGGGIIIIYGVPSRILELIIDRSRFLGFSRIFEIGGRGFLGATGRMDNDDDDDYEALLSELDGISTSPVKNPAPAASPMVRVPYFQCPSSRCTER